eukprot:604850_1
MIQNLQCLSARSNYHKTKKSTRTKLIHLTKYQVKEYFKDKNGDDKALKKGEKMMHYIATSKLNARIGAVCGKVRSETEPNETHTVSFHVDIQVEPPTHRIISTFCSCTHFKSTRRACKHIAALVIDRCQDW